MAKKKSRKDENISKSDCYVSETDSDNDCLSNESEDFDIVNDEDLIPPTPKKFRLKRKSTIKLFNDHKCRISSCGKVTKIRHQSIKFSCTRKVFYTLTQDELSQLYVTKLPPICKYSRG